MQEKTPPGMKRPSGGALAVETISLDGEATSLILLEQTGRTTLGLLEQTGRTTLGLLEQTGRTIVIVVRVPIPIAGAAT
jgi:hypothetical protein